jgi:hypothetical protein
MGQIQPPSSSPELHRHAASESSASGFAALILLALTDTAARSQRAQADLSAALLAFDLPQDHARVSAALRLLRSQGCIAGLIPLSDGGLLLTVTGRPMGQSGRVSQWLPSEEPRAPSQGTGQGDDPVPGD